MKQILDHVSRNTGLTRSESIVVLTVALLLLLGWVGRTVTAEPPTHNVVHAERVIELLDSMVARSREQDTTSPVSVETSANRSPTATSRSNPKRKVTETVLRVRVNTASSGQLEQLPGIGPATATKIIQARPFATADDLLTVRGIGPAKLSRIRPFIIVP